MEETLVGTIASKGSTAKLTFTQKVGKTCSLVYKVATLLYVPKDLVKG